MKKAVVCCVIFACLLAGCQKKQTVGICLRQEDAYLSQLLAQQLREKMEADGYRVIMENAHLDQQTQNTQMDRMLQEGAQVLIIEPVLTAQSQETVLAAQKADVPLVFLNYPPAEPVPSRWQWLSCVGYDLADAAKVQNEAVSALPHGGDVNADAVTSCLLIGGPEDHLDAAAWMEAAGNFPRARILTRESGDWTRESGRLITARAIGKHGTDLDVVLCCNDEMTLGALDALQAEGKTVGEDIHLLGIGGDETLLELVKQGKITATVCPDLAHLSGMLTDITAGYFARSPAGTERKLPFLAITKENVESFRGK